MADTFVLIAGEWHGRQAWHPVAEHLRAAGHGVHTHAESNAHDTNSLTGRGGAKLDKRLPAGWQAGRQQLDWTVWYDHRPTGSGVEANSGEPKCRAREDWMQGGAR
jgi:hypothetical protein